MKLLQNKTSIDCLHYQMTKEHINRIDFATKKRIQIVKDFRLRFFSSFQDNLRHLYVNSHVN